jgi:hypothetical protein
MIELETNSRVKFKISSDNSLYCNNIGLDELNLRINPTIIKVQAYNYISNILRYNFNIVELEKLNNLLFSSDKELVNLGLKLIEEKVSHSFRHLVYLYLNNRYYEQNDLLIEQLKVSLQNQQF